MIIPGGLDAQRGLGPAWADWLDRLPALADQVVEDWQLTLDGEPMNGFCSLVAPVRTAGGDPAVLKVTFDGDDESEHEGLALQRWGGQSTVRLLRADPHRRALLLERLHREDLTAVWDVEACEIIGGLYSTLHVPAMPQLRTVTSYVARRTEEMQALARDAPIPRRLVEQATALVRDLVEDDASTGTLIHGDLHYENVLAGDREPWIVIDPKPMSGDPHYEPAPLLWNRWDELQGDIRGGVRRRFHAVIDAAGLDEDRARDWVVVRMVLGAHWSIARAERENRALDADLRERVTRCITIAKAVQG